MKSVFQFREGCHLSGDAQTVGEHLEAIRMARANLTPEIVLDDARKTTSPLHSFFEWNNAKAAEQYRLQQAGHLIRSVQVTYQDIEPQPERQISLTPVITETPRPVRAFVAVMREGERGYESTRVAMNDVELRRQVLARAHSELDSVARKWRELKELSDVFGALDRVGELLSSSEGQSA